MKPLQDVTAPQLAILEVLWAREEATANEVHQALEPDAQLARGTVGTMLHRLERQGLLTHRTEGREFLYRATVTRDEMAAARLNGLVGGIFRGDLTAMVSFAVSQSDTKPGDLARLRRMLDAHQTKKGRKRP